MEASLKSILRPIRNTLLSSSNPSPEPKQSPHERDMERNLARIQGFTSLETIDELLAWNEDSENQQQRSNIPLVPRPTPSHPVDIQGNAKTIVIHDYGTAFHDYEASNSCTGVQEEQFSLDTGQMQHMSSFIYFSHNLVSCPPPSWINTLHRNGVKVLGTFIVEPQTPVKDIGRTLTEKDEQGRFRVAKVLGRIARWVGFEGWIVNIEGIFPEEVWSADGMEGMCEFLRELRGMGEVIWYDALTTSNRISHQNALTPSNLPFVLASGSFLTNYTWTPNSITNSLSLALKHSLDPSDLSFGIDIWAQNRPRNFWHPRITWPIFDGGGTNTGVAVAKCAELGVGAGLFGVAWCWEHFNSTSDRKEAEGALWRGEELGKDVTCGCDEGFWGKRGADVHRTERYREFAVVKSASRFAVGGEQGFWTDFEKAVVGHGRELDEIFGGKKMHAQLGAQGIMPLPVEEDPERKIWWEIREQPSRLNILAKPSSGTDPMRRYVKLYDLGICFVPNTRLLIWYSFPRSSSSISAGILLKCRGSAGDSQEIVLPLSETDPLSKGSLPFEHILSPATGKDTGIFEIGVLIVGDVNEEQPVLDIMEISLGSPESFPADTGRTKVTNMRIAYQGRDEWRRGRLTWNLDYERTEKRSEWWSERTGPVAYFEVVIDGLLIGRSYGLEFILPDAVVRQWQNGDGMSVEVKGALFGGTRLSGNCVKLKENREEIG